MNKQDNTTEFLDEMDKSDGNSTLPTNGNKLRKRVWLKYVIAAIVLAALTLVVAWIQDGFKSTNTKVLLGSWGDAFAIPGFVTICVGALIWVSNGGAFDIFAYGARSFVRMFRKDMKDYKYPTYNDYREAQREKKRSFVFLLIVGGAFTLVGIVLLICYSQI